MYLINSSNLATHEMWKDWDHWEKKTKSAIIVTLALKKLGAGLFVIADMVSNQHISVWGGVGWGGDCSRDVLSSFRELKWKEKFFSCETARSHPSHGIWPCSVPKKTVKTQNVLFKTKLKVLSLSEYVFQPKLATSDSEEIRILGSSAKVWHMYFTTVCVSSQAWWLISHHSLLTQPQPFWS